MTHAQKKTIIITLGIAIGIAAIYFSGIHTYFSLEAIKEKQHYFYEYVQDHYLWSVFVFISLYTVLLTAGLPVQPPFTLIGGYIFGFLPGVLYSLTSCVFGSMISFFLLRTIFRPWIINYGKRFEKFKERVKKDGSSYLLTLHFLSILPYFMINMVAALADMPYITVLWVTLLGSVPLIVVYSLAAHELATICSASDIFSPGVIIALILLALCALLPMIIKRIKKDPNP